MTRARAPELEPEATEFEDVDDLVGIASELMQRDEAQLERDELHTIGRELDIPPEYLEEARVELARRRALETTETTARVAWRKKVVLVLGGCLVVLGLAMGFGYASTASTLRAHHAELSAAQGQVQNVRARQDALNERLSGRAPTPYIDSEFIGAENRVRVETQRYGQCAAQYNEAASGAWASFVAGLAGLPPSVPATP